MTASMNCPCSFLFTEGSGARLSAGEAELALEQETLSIMPKFGEPVYTHLMDISQISLGDYRVMISISSGEKLALYDLGFKFGDFITNLHSARNEVIVKSLLMKESVKKPAVWGELTIESLGVTRRHERCEIRIYETALVLMPSDAEPIRLHFCNVGQIEAKDFSIEITTDSADKVIVSKLGSEYENLARDLSDAINALNVQTQAILKELSASSGPAIIRNLARLMNDGKAASNVSVKSLSPNIWSDFEKKLEQTQIWNEYQYLKSIARQDLIAVGVKRGLMGDITGNYLWFMVPIYGGNTDYGNAIAMESVRITTTEQKDLDLAKGPESNAVANATYFFRITRPQEYAKIAANIEQLDAEANRSIQKLSRLMIDINFRREPIFLSDEKLRGEPQYAKYRYAVQRIPSLRELRNLFIGRVIHSSFEQWKSDVASILKFNMTAPDDGKWQKS
jgi:hypothetical protein